MCGVLAFAQAAGLADGYDYSLYLLKGSTSIVGVEKKEIVSSGAGSTLGTAFMCGKTGYVF